MALSINHGLAQALYQVAEGGTDKAACAEGAVAVGARVAAWFAPGVIVIAAARRSRHAGTGEILDWKGPAVPTAEPAFGA
jgi:hypothetical protein